MPASSTPGTALAASQANTPAAPKGSRTGNAKLIRAAGVTNLAQNAFRGCRKLTSVTIPASVAYIRMQALFDCNELTGVYFEGDAPQLQTERDVFGNDTKATIYYRSGTKGWGQEFGGRPTAVWTPPEKSPKETGP